MRLSIIGSGYVGLVTGCCLARFCRKVIFVDIDENKVRKINSKEAPFYETGLDELIKEVGNKIEATTDIEYAVLNSDASFICVGTPQGLLGEADLRYVYEATRSIAEAIKEKDYHLIVVKSTVPPGTTRYKILPILEEHSGKRFPKDFGLIMNPEFLREGNAIEDFLKPDRIVIGYEDEKSREIIEEIYKGIRAPRVYVDFTTAEMIKYASNAFLAVKISFINEIGNICKLLGIDVYKVAEGMGLDRRIGKEYLRAGIGFGGSCFPKDLKALISKAREVFYTPLILNAALEVNEMQPYKLVEIAEKRLGSLNKRNVTVLGLAFKPGTDDIREAPSIKIVKALLDKGAKVFVYDPKAMENFKRIFKNEVIYCKDAKDAVSKSDVIFIVTEWDEFKNPELYRDKIVFDGRRIDEAKILSKHYEGVCW